MRDIATAQANLQASIPLISTRYRQGVQNADWATPASSDAAEQLWAQEVAAAAAQKRRQRGIQKVGNSVWQQAAMGKGATNIGPGITAGLQKYGQNFGPVLQAMQQAVQGLKPRTADPVANVQNRVIPVIMAARKAVGKT